MLMANQLYTPPDVLEAYETFHANCGPGALAAILKRPVMTLQPFLDGFMHRQYMNPTQVKAALTRVARAHVPVYPAKVWPPPARPEDVWPTYGLLFLQWEGPWTQPGVPARVAYRHTHWVGVADTQDVGVMLYDVNVVHPADGRLGGWMRSQDWQETLVPQVTATMPRASGGWFARWACAVQREGDQDA